MESEEIKRYVDAASKALMGTNFLKWSSEKQIEFLKSLTYEQKLGVWINNFILTEMINALQATSIKEDDDISIRRLASFVDIYKKLAKIHTVFPIVSSFGILDEKGCRTQSQIAVLNNATYHRMSVYKGDIFIYSVDGLLDMKRTSESVENKYIMRYFTISTDKNIKTVINLSGE